MSHFYKIGVLLLALGISSTAVSKKVPIDQVPMYGGMDRSAVPRLKKGDEQFIADASKAFGSREAAAKVWVEQGFVYYQKDNLKKAMQRFNQAWLLDPNNPEVYWGFSSVLYDQGDNCGAMQIGLKAEEVGIVPMIPPSKGSFLADLAMITSICAVDSGTKKSELTSLVAKSDELFNRAESIWPSAYLYDKWWQALYWRGEYASAWEKVSAMRENGEEPFKDFIQLLREKMPEPQL